MYERIVDDPWKLDQHRCHRSIGLDPSPYFGVCFFVTSPFQQFFFWSHLRLAGPCGPGEQALPPREKVGFTDHLTLKMTDILSMVDQRWSVLESRDVLGQAAPKKDARPWQRGLKSQQLQKSCLDCVPRCHYFGLACVGMGHFTLIPCWSHQNLAAVDHTKVTHTQMSVMWKFQIPDIFHFA